LTVIHLLKFSVLLDCSFCYYY